MERRSEVFQRRVDCSPESGAALLSFGLYFPAPLLLVLPPAVHPTSGHPAICPSIPGGEETTLLCHGALGDQLQGSCE